MENCTFSIVDTVLFKYRCCCPPPRTGSSSDMFLSLRGGGMACRYSVVYDPQKSVVRYGKLPSRTHVN